MKKTSFLIGAVLFSGLVWACVQNISRGAVVEVTEAAVAEAAAQGYRNPLRAAALAELDDWGSLQFGSRWESESFMGNFTYRYRNWPYNSVFDKPCGQKAIDEVPIIGSGGSGGVGDGNRGSTGTGGGGIVGGGPIGGWACTSAGGGPAQCYFVIY